MSPGDANPLSVAGAPGPVLVRARTRVGIRVRSGGCAARAARRAGGRDVRSRLPRTGRCRRFRRAHRAAARMRRTPRPRVRRWPGPHHEGGEPLVRRTLPDRVTEVSRADHRRSGCRRRTGFQGDELALDPDCQEVREHAPVGPDGGGAAVIGPQCERLPGEVGRPQTSPADVAARALARRSWATSTSTSRCRGSRR